VEFVTTIMTDAETQALGLTERVKRRGVPMKATVNADRSILLVYLDGPMPEDRNYMDMVLVWKSGQPVSLSCNWGSERLVDGVRHVEMNIYEMLVPTDLEQMRPYILDVLKDAIFVLMQLKDSRDILSLTDLNID
jgi:hypothetical protein